MDHRSESDLPAWIEESIRNSIWSARPVDEEPTIRLIRWQIIEVRGRRYFVGFNPDFPEGRISSMVVAFDPTSRRGITESGRVYHLLGPPGRHPDAEYVLEVWKGARGLTDDDVVDVTAAATKEADPA